MHGDRTPPSRGPSRQEVERLQRSIRQLESAHSRGDLARVLEIATSLDQKARGIGDESLATLFGRLQAAETLVPDDLAALVDEAVLRSRCVLQGLKIRHVLNTPPGVPIWRTDPRLRLA